MYRWGESENKKNGAANGITNQLKRQNKSILWLQNWKRNE